MSVVFTATGLFLVLLSFYEQFQTLFHPPGHGTTTDWISRTVWATFKRFARRRPASLSLAGPIALILIILTWAGLVAVGCALIYYPRLGSFAVPQDLAGRWHPSLLSALNISFASLVTVTPDLIPTNPWIRLAMILEGGVGLGLLTASVSWLLSIYPVLEGRSSLAEQAMSLFEAERDTGLDLFEMAESVLADILFGIAGELSTLRNQTVQFPITYYFGVQSRRASLEIAMPYIDGLAMRACEAQRSATLRLAGHSLDAAIMSYLRLLGERFLNLAGESKEVLLRAYNEDNLRSGLPKTAGQSRARSQPRGAA
jgi:hypothetical protein